MKSITIFCLINCIVFNAFAQEEDLTEEKNAMENVHVKKIEKVIEVLPEDQQRDKVKELFEGLYKNSISNLKDPNVQRGYLLHCANTFESLSEEQFLEEVTKTQKEWFIKMSKGFKFLWKVKYRAEKAKQKNDKVAFDKAVGAYDNGKKKLIAILKARKKEYGVKKQ